MSKKRILKVAVIATLVVLLFTAGYTFSKYRSSVSGAVNGSVAKWSFIARGANSTNIQNINLLDTANQVSLVNGKIAPGTSGSFAIEVDASQSEVGVDYHVDVTGTTGTVPANMKFYKVGDLDGNGDQIKYDTLAELASSALTGTILPSDNSKVHTLTVNWEWPYEFDGDENDEDYEEDFEDYDDTDMTVSSGGNYSFSLSIVGEQHKNS